MARCWTFRTTMNARKLGSSGHNNKTVLILGAQLFKP